MNHFKKTYCNPIPLPDYPIGRKSLVEDIPVSYTHLRPFLVFNAAFSQEKIGDMDSCMTVEFFRAFAYHAKITLHLSLLYGVNAHHQTEALFKAAAHVLKDASAPSGNNRILSAKGVL